MRTISISASLVLYRPDLDMIAQTLLALQAAAAHAKAHYGLELAITLVDNSDDKETFASITKWFEAMPARCSDWRLSLLNAAGNLGYGRGNNLVIATVESDYHIVINPDLFVQPDALMEALSFMESNPEVGLLTAEIRGQDGQRQFLCKRNPTLLIMFLRSVAPKWLQSVCRPLLDEFEMRNCDYSKIIHPVEYPTGSFMFFRTKALKDIGGFDPDYFLHYEDADIGRRMLRVAKTYYVPRVRVTHLWARDTHRSLRAMIVTMRSGLLYWRKWGGVLGSPSASESLVAKPPSGGADQNPLTGEGRRVLVTGANGFVGRAVCAELPRHGYEVLGVVRRKLGDAKSGGLLEMDRIDETTEWSDVLTGVHSVVHAAARVHMMDDLSADPLTEFRRVNVDLTLNLARQAAACGVRRFIFVSSVKVNGESTPVGQPYTAEDAPRPQDPYGFSKWEAEQGLMEIAAESGMEVVILRPVLVYGPGVKANFLEMLRTLSKSSVLPLGALDNRRSLCALDNLTGCITTCLAHPRAANQVFMVSDGEDLSVSSLLRRTSAAMQRSAILVLVPVFLMRIGGRVLGKQAIVSRLCDSLQVDITKTRHQLDWHPPVSVDVAINKTVQHFLSG